jgi:hypothetical protein
LRRRANHRHIYILEKLFKSPPPVNLGVGFLILAGTRERVGTRAWLSPAPARGPTATIRENRRSRMEG